MTRVTLTVTDVRNEIRRAAGVTAAEASANATTGKLFHQVAAELLGTQGANNWESYFDPDRLHAEDAAESLSRHVYDRLLGPLVTARRAALAESGPELLGLWKAVQDLCAWSTGALRELEQRGIIRFDSARSVWTYVESLVQTEQSFTWTLPAPGMEIEIVGRPDCLWIDPATQRLCVLEWKLSRSTPEADLAQVCLYHKLLQANSSDSLAVIWFAPQLDMQCYTARSVSEAQDRLVELIVQMAKTRLNPVERGPVVAFARSAEPDTEQLGNRIVRVLAEFGVNAKLSGPAIVGPTFLRYHVMPGKGVSATKLHKLTGDLQIHLGLRHPVVIGVENGRIAIDVERTERQTVLLSSVEDQLPLPAPTGSSRFPVGVDLNGRLRMADFADSGSAHLLVAGSTGSGKSEWLLSMIAGLMQQNTPLTLRFVLVDPKRVSFVELEHSPYLFENRGIVFPLDEVDDILQRMCELMDERYHWFSQNGVKNLSEFQERTGEVHPRVVVVIDEFADLMSDKLGRKQLEGNLRRLSAKARGAGIHLVLATQRPSREVVSGLIKSNCGGRVCLRVTSKLESKLILDTTSVSGSDLLGKGDLYFLAGNEPVRLQSPFVGREERDRYFRSERVRAAG